MDEALSKESVVSNRIMCRLCLSSNTATEPIGYNDQYLIQKIFECTTVQIIPLPGIASVLCTICRARLDDFYHFRWQCITNDEIIHRIAAGSNQKPHLADATENDKRMHGPGTVYSNNPPEMGCTERQADAKTQPHAEGISVSDGYSSFGSKYSDSVSTSPAISENPLNVRRKRGRPPKQQYDFGTPLVKVQTPVVGEHSDSMQRFTDSRWNCTPSSSGSIPHHTDPGPLRSSSENQEGQKWLKIKLEQTDQQTHPTGNIPDGPQNSLALESSDTQFNTGSSKPLNHGLVGVTSSQIQATLSQTGTKRSRGRPPREGGCPNEDREEYRFLCQYCNARFKAAINLKLHTNTHTGEKPYLCTICNKSFAHPSNLSVHMKLHSNQPVMSSGENSVPYRGSLKEHDQEKLPGHASQPDKKFQCPYCHTLFALAFQLKIHINTHTGQKPYVCKNCGKGFAQPSNLHVHSKKHCRRKQAQFGHPTAGDTQSGGNFTPTPVENAPLMSSGGTSGVSAAFGRVSSYQLQDQISDNSAPRTTHHQGNMDESQRSNLPVLNANHVMLV